jgi:hypothetical protein
VSTRPWRSWAGYAAGAAMFGLGIKEALRVGRGSLDDARTSARFYDSLPTSVHRT